MTKDVPSIHDLVAAPQAMLKERLTHLLASLHPALHVDVIRALQGENKLLFRAETHTDLSRPAPLAGTWALTTFFIAQYVSPEVNHVWASHVALAVECYVCAIDLLDDVIDDDQTTTLLALGSARALNTSTALLTLAHQFILSLADEGADSSLIMHLLDAFEDMALLTAVGQHRDVLAEQLPGDAFTQEECMEIAAAKAGAIVRMSLRLGAICAGADDALLQHLSEMGELVGIAHQLDNDTHDLYNFFREDGTSPTLTLGVNSAHTSKSDLQRGKKTLPIVLAARSGVALQNFAALTDEEKKQHLPAFQEAILAAWGMCLLYRERARECLQELEAQKPVALALRLLLGLA